MSSPTFGSYGVLKAAWHTDRIEGLRNGERVAPISIQLILSDLCNHDCFFCAYRASDGLSSEGFGVMENGVFNTNPNRMITTEKATEIIEDAAEIGVNSITFTGGGEPTVHPDHLKMFELALSLGLDCSLNTNGDLMRKGWEQILPRFKYVRFSIDAGTAEEYAEIRRVPASRYEKVLGHLSSLVAEVKKQETECVVGTGYVVTPGNYVNVIEGVKRIRDTGASYVRLASMQSTKGVDIYGGKWDEALEKVREAVELSCDGFEAVNLFDVAQGRKMTDSYCGMQDLVVYIGANLKTYRCCYVAYTGLGESGDLANMRLRDWLNDPAVVASYAGFDARSCSTCPLADKNAVIGYLRQQNPKHVNFI